MVIVTALRGIAHDGLFVALFSTFCTQPHGEQTSHISASPMPHSAIPPVIQQAPTFSTRAAKQQASNGHDRWALNAEHVYLFTMDENADTLTLGQTVCDAVKHAVTTRTHEHTPSTFMRTRAGNRGLPYAPHALRTWDVALRVLRARQHHAPTAHHAYRRVFKQRRDVAWRTRCIYKTSGRGYERTREPHYGENAMWMATNIQPFERNAGRRYTSTAVVAARGGA